MMSRWKNRAERGGRGREGRSTRTTRGAERSMVKFRTEKQKKDTCRKMSDLLPVRGGEGTHGLQRCRILRES